MTPREQIQERLVTLGYDIGSSGVDGIMGRDTIAAIAKFQADRGLDIRWPGTVGPITMAALGLEAVENREVPWMTEAARYLGMQEGTARADKALNLNSAAIPWCGAFVGMVISTTLPHEPLPKNQLWARDWLKFGRDPGGVYFGNVAVFERGAGGHVGFVAGHEKSYLHILGGNQSNRVSVAKIAKSRLLGYRWPKTFELDGDPLEYSKFTGKVSTNEA